MSWITDKPLTCMVAWSLVVILLTVVVSPDAGMVVILITVVGALVVMVGSGVIKEWRS